jgi:hypothetical protein
VLTWDIAPGYQHTFNANYLLTVNPYIRKDEFSYFPSRNLLERHYAQPYFTSIRMKCVGVLPTFFTS